MKGIICQCLNWAAPQEFNDLITTYHKEEINYNMKNYFIVHALGNTGSDYWYQFVKNKIESMGYDCYVPTLPPVENMSYHSWAKAFDKYKEFINEESVYIGHSTGAIFGVRYLMDNNLKISKYISVVGFNKENTSNPHPIWEEINKTFFVKDLKKFKDFAKERISFYSPTDIYDFNLLNEFAEEIDAKTEIIERAGHFTKGYETEFNEILKCL